MSPTVELKRGGRRELEALSLLRKLIDFLLVLGVKILQVKGSWTLQTRLPHLPASKTLRSADKPPGEESSGQTVTGEGLGSFTVRQQALALSLRSN